MSAAYDDEIESLYNRLSVEADYLNKVSDRLNEDIKYHNSRLKGLSLGVYVVCESNFHVEEDDLGCKTGYHLAYGKIDSQWQILVEPWIEEGQLDSTFSVGRQYPLLSARRDLRVRAMQGIPLLLKVLIEKARDFSEDIQQAGEHAGDAD